MIRIALDAVRVAAVIAVIVGVVSFALLVLFSVPVCIALGAIFMGVGVMSGSIGQITIGAVLLVAGYVLFCSIKIAP